MLVMGSYSNGCVNSTLLASRPPIAYNFPFAGKKTPTKRVPALGRSGPGPQLHIAGVPVGVDVGVELAIAVAVAVGVGEGVPHGPVKTTSSIHWPVVSPGGLNPSWCTRNFRRTVCPAYCAIFTVTFV